MSGNLYSALKDACPPGFEVFYAPVDWRPDCRTSLQPDLVVVVLEDVEGHHLTGPIALAIEVLSPTTQRKDQVLKRSKYEEAGVPSYWLVDPRQPSILALDLVNGSYVTAAEGTGDAPVRLTRPFPLAVVPRDLARPAGRP